MTAAIIRLASTYGRYGYRRITALLWKDGWRVSTKRVRRIWRREGLKVPQKQPKRGRLWLNDGSCVRLRPEHQNHVWAYDFVADRTHDGRPLRMLTVIDEYTRESLAIEVERRLRSDDVLHCLVRLFAERGPPQYIRSDNGSEFTANAVRAWLFRLNVGALYIEPGVLGRMATMNPSTDDCATSCSMVKSSTALSRPSCSSSGGADITTPRGRTLHLDTGRQHRKQSCCRRLARSTLRFGRANRRPSTAKL